MIEIEKTARDGRVIGNFVGVVVPIIAYIIGAIFATHIGIPMADARDSSQLFIIFLYNYCFLAPFTGFILIVACILIVMLIQILYITFIACYKNYHKVTGFRIKLKQSNSNK